MPKVFLEDGKTSELKYIAYYPENKTLIECYEEN